LSVWNSRWRAPLRSLAAQCAVTLLMILTVGTSPGRSAIDRLLLSIGQSPLDWRDRNGFRTLLDATAPVFWMFFLLTAISTLVLRWRDPALERPFRVPGYPVLPLIFIGACSYMFYSAAAYAGWLTFVGMAPLLLGLPLYAISEMMGRETA
jgi:amino acid transporter